MRSKRYSSLIVVSAFSTPPGYPPRFSWSGNAHSLFVIVCMQAALEIVRVWCAQNELSVNPKEAEAIFITRKTSTVNLKNLFLFLNIVYEVKYIEVIWDSKLNWNSHLDKSYWSLFDKCVHIETTIHFITAAVDIVPLLHFCSLRQNFEQCPLLSLLSFIRTTHR